MPDVLAPDVLTDVLARTPVVGVATSVAPVAAPWGIALGATRGAQFHVLVGTDGWLLPDDHRPVRIGPGDVAVVAPGHGHTLVDDPSTPPVALRTVAEVPRPERALGPVHAGAAGTLICGVFDALEPHPLLAGLPPVLHVEGTRPRLRAIVELLGAEGAGPGPGGQVMLDRLVDVLLVEVVRAFMEGTPEPCPVGWLRGLREPGVAPALGAVHAQPGHDWTVARLAATAGLSRAAFARRFTEVVGTAPLRYVTSWRMTVAADLLRTTDLTLDAIAARTGYASGFALSRAFSRERGEAPSAHRARVAAG